MLCKFQPWFWRPDKLQDEKSPLYIKEFRVVVQCETSGIKQKGRQSSKEMAHAFPHSLRMVIKSCKN